LGVGWQRPCTGPPNNGITFAEAATVFADPLALILDDEWHSVMEEREIIIGHSTDGHLLAEKTELKWSA
jgi:uncharacterized protein